MGFDSVLRLLFEGVKHIHRQFKANRVNGAVGVAVEIFDKFNHTTTDAFQHLGRWRMLSGLSQEQFKAAQFLHLWREFPVVLAAGPNPQQGTSGRGSLSIYAFL